MGEPGESNQPSGSQAPDEAGRPDALGERDVAAEETRGSEGGAARFELDWHLEVDHEAAGTLAEALAPETGEFATMQASERALELEGSGSAGQSLHTLDDILACLTGAIDAWEAGEEETPADTDEK